jgi:hypothetical protein
MGKKISQLLQIKKGLLFAKVTTLKRNTFHFATPKVGHNMFAISTQVFKSNQWQLRSSLRQPMGVEAFCT